MASWEKNHHHNNNNNNNKVASKVSLESCNKMSWNHHTFGKDNHQHSIPNNKEATKTVIEHGKPRASSLRWRKRIGHVFQLIRWKRSNKAGTVCHASTKVEGVKVRKGWIRTLTKKRTTTMEWKNIEIIIKPIFCRDCDTPITNAFFFFQFFFYFSLFSFPFIFLFFSSYLPPYTNLWAGAQKWL